VKLNIHQNDEHNILTLLLTAFCEKNPEYELLLEPKRSSSSAIRTILQAFRRVFHAGRLGVRTRKSIIIREFTTIEYFAFALVPWYAKQIVLNVNHNFSGGLSRIILANIMSKLGYRFLLIDGEDCEIELEKILSRPIITFRSRECLPLPVRPEIVDSHRSRSVLVLGARLSNFECQELCESLERLGCSSKFGGRSVLSMKPLKNQLVLDDRASYLAALQKTELVIFIPRPSDYVWRHSGTLWDAMRMQKLVIYPALPVFKRQLSEYSLGFEVNSFATISEMASRVQEVFDNEARLPTARML
jgi:hypothetical protein